MQISESEHVTKRFALLELAFRPFFLGAVIFSVLAMIIWTGIYRYGWEFEGLKYHLSATNWHAHEMVYGYALAVIAGFLLTAVRNWTNVQTVKGAWLLLLFLLWLSARLAPFLVSSVEQQIISASLDLLFNVGLIVAVAAPLIKARAWPNLGMIASKLVFMLAGNIVYYLGVFGIVTLGTRYGVYIGFYLVLSLILLFSRRVFPMFIERGVDESVELKNSKLLDISSMIVFVLFVISDLIDSMSVVTGVLALVLLLIHVARLVNWYTAGLWRKPLLWVLYVAYAWLVGGFALKAASVFLGVSPFLALHAFAYGGVGMVTCGMMLRVSLGHTGRMIHEPPKLAGVLFVALLLGCLFRVLMPLLLPEYYSLWVLYSQTLWIIAFALLAFIFLPILLFSRVDGKPG